MFCLQINIRNEILFDFHEMKQIQHLEQVPRLSIKVNVHGPHPFQSRYQNILWAR